METTSSLSQSSPKHTVATISRPAVEAEGLVKTYPGGIQALKGGSISVRPGTVFALLGPNGAGKSTMVKILTTLSRPTAGRASIVGRDIVREPGRVRCAIGVVAQKSAVDLEATAAENLTLQGQLYGLSGAELRRRVTSLLERFDLTDAHQRIARTLSGGMQRKLDVAMGLIHQPQVLFLDEPTTGLDPEVRADMWREIARLAREDGLTVVLTTHYLEEADHLAQHVAIIDHGQIVVEGTPEGLKAELRGDAIQVELTEALPESSIRAVLSSLNGMLREVAVDGRVLRARMDSGASALPTILAALDTAIHPRIQLCHKDVFSLLLSALLLCVLGPDGRHHLPHQRDIRQILLEQEEERTIVFTSKDGLLIPQRGHHLAQALDFSWNDIRISVEMQVEDIVVIGPFAHLMREELPLSLLHRQIGERRVGDACGTGQDHKRLGSSLFDGAIEDLELIHIVRCAPMPEAGIVRFIVHLPVAYLSLAVTNERRDHVCSSLMCIVGLQTHDVQVEYHRPVTLYR